METPRFLRELMSRPEYRNPNSDEYIKAQKYFNLLYPGTAQTDITGRLGTPKYDMTSRDFIKLRHEVESDFEESKQEAEQEILEEFGEYFENVGIDFNIDDYVVPKDLIQVNVLYPGGEIVNKKIDIYGLDIPDFKKQAKVWRWHSEQLDTTCDECSALDGAVFFAPDDAPEIPIHPNCQCSITEDTLDDNGNTIHSKTYKGAPQPHEKENEKTENAPTFSKPVNVKEGMYAKFDGKTLTIYMDDKPVYQFDAVSGRPGYQDPKYQDVKGTGPIPTGIYVARQEAIQHMTIKDWGAGWALAGAWPGSEMSWGESRVWLEPSKETNTYGRDSFSIHGGWFSGSNGCIDLTDQINNFIALFEFMDKDLIVNVEY